MNSDGKVTEFSFDGSTKTVRAGEEQTVIFHESEGDAAETMSEDITNIPEDTNKTGAGSSMGIIGGADGPTSIYISGNPFKAWIIPVILLAVVTTTFTK